MKLHIVLHEPEIPQNTGNIARTCSAIGAELHLVEPLGFSIDERAVRRAGLDYWDSVTIHRYDSLEEFFSRAKPENLFLASTKGKRNYCDPDFPEETFLLFGKESKGLPESLLRRYPDHALRIPMLKDRRSLNLANAVAVMAFEVLRQHEFSLLEQKGQPKSFSWG